MISESDSTEMKNKMGIEQHFCFSVQNQGSSVLQQLDLMRASEVLTDVIIIAEQKEFPCHRVVLAANSQYFKAMFSYGLKESHELKVPIHGVPSDIMQLIVQYAYTGNCELRKENVAEIMMAADLFQILPLKDAALKFLFKCIDVNNCLFIRRLADEHSCADLSTIATQYARDHFKDVIIQEEFLDLDVCDLTSYLADDELTVAKEDIVFDAAMRWVRHKPERQRYISHVLGEKGHILNHPYWLMHWHMLSKLRKGDILKQTLMESVRLPFVTPEYLKKRVAEEPLIRTSDNCVKQISDARTFQVSGKFREDFESDQRRPRKCTSKEVLIVFGGECRIGNYHECIHDVSYYDPSARRWSTLELVPGTLHTQAFAAVSLGYDIYITGGVVSNKPVNDVRVFYTYLNKWCSVDPMTVPRYHHSAVVVNSQVYVIGGTDGIRCLDHVEKYNAAENKWVAVEPLVHAVKCPAVAAYDNKMYVFGGFLDTYVICQSIQVYDPFTRGWIALSCPKIDYTCAQAVCLDHRIYLLGGCSKVVKVYDPETDSIDRISDMETKRDNCGATVVDGKIFVTGGISVSNGPSLDSVECYCPILKKWESITPMPSRLYRHGSVHIRIPVYKKEIVKEKRKK